MQKPWEVIVPLIDIPGRPQIRPCAPCKSLGGSTFLMLHLARRPCTAILPGENKTRNYGKPMEEQHKILIDAFENWRGDLEQVDDVCIIGVRI